MNKNMRPVDLSSKREVSGRILSKKKEIEDDSLPDDVIMTSESARSEDK
jgi:hypothetical protein